MDLPPLLEETCVSDCARMQTQLSIEFDDHQSQLCTLNAHRAEVQMWGKADGMSNLLNFSNSPLTGSIIIHDASCKERISQRLLERWHLRSVPGA